MTIPAFERKHCLNLKSNLTDDIIIHDFIKRKPQLSNEAFYLPKTRILSTSTSVIIAMIMRENEIFSDNLRVLSVTKLGQYVKNIARWMIAWRGVVVFCNKTVANQIQIGLVMRGRR